MSSRPGRHFLQIPGPSNSPDRILAAMAKPTMDHRGPDFGVWKKFAERYSRYLQDRASCNHLSIFWNWSLGSCFS